LFGRNAFAVLGAVDKILVQRRSMNEMLAEERRAPFAEHHGRLRLVHAAEGRGQRQIADGGAGLGQSLGGQREGLVSSGLRLVPERRLAERDLEAAHRDRLIALEIEDLESLRHQ
jgi:hypothetical protein